MTEIGIGSGRRRWLLIILCANMMAFLYAARNLFASISIGRPIDWQWVVGYQFLYWYIWAAVTPLILWCARHFPIERPRHVLRLIAFGLLISPLQAFAEAGIVFALGQAGYMTEQRNQFRHFFWAVIVVEAFSYFIVYAFTVGIYFALDYYRKYRQREMRSLELEARLTQAELQNLKAQLHPHFLFNTLHSISVLMMRDTQVANRMLINLSDLLRATLDNAGAQEVKLKQELDFQRSYLQIEQTRFQDRLKVTIDAEPETMDARVPNLILQPLVENAIRHGIGAQTGKGLLQIQTKRVGNELVLLVIDNGPGLPQTTSGRSRQGVGLSNSEARLKRLYGESYKFELTNSPNGGLQVMLTIPFRTDEEAI